MAVVIYTTLLLIFCVILLVVSSRTDDKSTRPLSVADPVPMRRSIAALKYENQLLKEKMNRTLTENAQLRARLIKSGFTFEKSRSSAAAAPAAAQATVKPPAPVAADLGGRPVPLVERLLTNSVEFNEERARAVAKNGQLLLTFVNKIRLDFATSWVGHVRRLGMTNWLVGATDQPALKALTVAGTPCFDMSTNLPEGEWPWGSPSFKALGPHKIELIYKSIQWGLEVIITDIDAFVLREPFAYMARWPDAGFLTTSDHLGNTTSDSGLEDHRGIHTAFNIGYMFFRKSALPLVEEWRRVIREQPTSRWDQGEFNRIARFEWDFRNTKGLSDPRLFWSYKRLVVGGVLPLSLFCGGHNYFVSQFAQRMQWEPYSIHTTYQYAAAAGKRHRLREARVWLDPPEYYDPPGGLLSFTLDTPHAMVYPAGGMTVQGHVALISHQVRQIRSGLALAHALGRKLVLPSVTCGYDKYWGPLYRGVIPGTHQFALPIRDCPLDHFVEVGMLDPVATVREYSMLRNPRTPAAVTRDVRHVAIDANAREGAEFRRLAAMKDAKVLNITSLFTQVDLTHRRSRVLTSEQQRSFRDKFGRVDGHWCCAPVDELKKGAPRAATFGLMRV